MFLKATDNADKEQLTNSLVLKKSPFDQISIKIFKSVKSEIAPIISNLIYLS